MPGARRVHVIGPDGGSLCGRMAPPKNDVARLHVRRRFTSAVDCRYCLRIKSARDAAKVGSR